MYVCMLVHVRGVCACARVFFFTTRVFNIQPFLFLEFLYSLVLVCFWCVDALMDGDYWGYMYVKKYVYVCTLCTHIACRPYDRTNYR